MTTQAHTETARLREDILAGLRAAEDSTTGDMTADQLLDAYDTARRNEILTAAAEELADRVPPPTAGPLTEHDRKLLLAAREVQQIADRGERR